MTLPSFSKQALHQISIHGYPRLTIEEKVYVFNVLVNMAYNTEFIRTLLRERLDEKQQIQKTFKLGTFVGCLVVDRRMRMWL